MATTVDRYVVEDGEGNEECGVYEAHKYDTAKEAARKIGGKVVCHEYEWSDSYVVDDFTA